MPRPSKAAAVKDFRALARRRLPHFLFEYIDGGSYDEATLARNIEDLRSIRLKQRVLNDVSSIDLSVDVFGERLSMPLVLAPVGLAGMNARRGEVQAARAAEKAGVQFCLSTVSVCPIDEVARATSKPFWFQLYVMRDRGFMRDLIAKAGELKCSALFFTVDMPMPGSRYRDYRSGLAGSPGAVGAARRFLQAAIKPDWALDVGVLGRPHHLGNVSPLLEGDTGLEDFFAWMKNNFDPTVTWREIEEARKLWNGPLIIKGVLDAEDARKAADCGVDGIVVSNHGGRQLDGAPSTAFALPKIAEAVGDEITVLADGGVRSGLDIVKMLALGADAVMIGRAWAYALAAEGGAGVARVIELMRDEMRIALALTGCTSARAADQSIFV